MKLLMVVAGLVVTLSTDAQISVNLNVGTPPVWAPSAPVQVKYYYLPDIEVYYDVPARRYMYLRNGRWFRSASLPSHYRGYDLYHGQTIFLTDYRGNTPYTNFKEHKIKYVGKKWEGYKNEKLRGKRKK